MKKMNLKKMLTMAMAAMMEMTTMSGSVSAMESMEGKVTIFEYDSETNTFDVSYVDESNVPAVLSTGDEFNFAQSINSSYQFLVNTTNSNPYLDSRLFNVETHNAIEMTLTSYDRNNKYYFEIYEGTNFNLIPVKEGVSPVLATPICYFSGLSQGHVYSFKLKKDGSSYTTAGTLESYTKQ